MFLNKINIENFRQYRDVNIEFAKEENKNITVIQGNNGTGKTTLLNAISWCLYGKEIHDYGDKSSMSICNNKSIYLSSEGDKVPVKVKIEFFDDKNFLIFERSQIFLKREGKAIRNKDGGSKLKVFSKDENDYKQEADEYIIDRKIPKEIEEYFFFDGAMLGNYFQEKSSSKIKETVFEISQLNLLENMKNNFKKVIGRYNEKLGEIEPDLGEASSNISKYEELIQKKEKELEDAKFKVDRAKDKKSNIENELIDLNSDDVTEIVKQNQKIEKDLEKLKKSKTKFEKERKDFILENYPIILSYNLFKEFLEKVESSRRKKYIPPEFTKNFIKDLLKENKCICGIDLETHEESRRVLEEILQKTPGITDNAEHVTRASSKVETLILESNTFCKNLKEINEVLNECKTEYDSQSDQKKKNDIKLKFNPIEKIKGLQQDKEDQEKIIENLTKKIGSLEGDGENKGIIEQYNTEKIIWEKKKNKEDQLTMESKKINNKIDFVNQSIISIEKIYDDFAQKLHENIEQLTKEKFLKLQWKEDEFVDIKLNHDYTVSIENSLGDYESPGDLSDGEKLCLGLCFMSALHNISGYILPIIMDTPLGNLDVDIRQNIAKFLPEFIGEKQAVLLVTGTEYTDDFRNIIFDNIGKEYTIEWEGGKAKGKGKESKVILNG
ncbi:MAG: AAA family ATPase [Methanobrevibacter sp.]|jgi:DNA sulfur modification protein DndD|nr:AAA family ATPase [Candidatus Methanoflexus mossambicus]